MADSWNNWLRKTLIALLLVAVAVPVWNLVLDPYHVYGHNLFAHDSLTVNERYLKVDHVIERKDTYDAFVLGTSTMGAVDPGLLEQRYPGVRYYNLSVLGALPNETLGMLKAISAGGVRVREVLYGIDLFPFHEQRSPSLATRPHPLATGESWLKFYFDYLFAPSLQAGFWRLVGQLDDVPAIRYDITNSGRYFLDGYELELSRDPEAFVAKHITSKWSASPPRRIAWIDDRFEEFATLIQWFKDNDVRVRLYMNPVHKSFRQLYTYEVHQEFRARLAKTGVVAMADCTQSLDHAIGYLYYDRRHFRPIAVPRILDCVDDERFQVQIEQSPVARIHSSGGGG